MTYDEFKRELFCNISKQECDNCRQIQLFENQSVERNDAGEFFADMNKLDLKGKAVHDD